VTGGYEGNAFGGCWRDVMNEHDMTWVHMLPGGVRRVHDVCESGV